MLAVSACKAIVYEGAGQTRRNQSKSVGTAVSASGMVAQLGFLTKEAIPAIYIYMVAEKAVSASAQHH